MCGIAGIVSFNESPVKRQDIKTMTDALIHRGPDGEGIWIDERAYVGLGHRRLTILDLTETGNQPMHYANGRYVLIFNGEIYNYIELKEELVKQGYKFISSSDTEVLLALYDSQKEKCLEKVDGMFAFAIWDNKEQTLFCARDRFGEKPFYYHRDENHFAFASEMKALFKAGIPKIQNQKKIYKYLLYTTLEDSTDISSTFYENIYQLEPAHYLMIRPDKKIVKKRYWDLDINRQSNLAENEAIEKFHELFTTSISRRLRSDVPVGSSLSGGLDSSSIVMLIDKMKRDNRVQKTFSARFKNFSRDEGAYMQMVIDKTNVEPHFVFPTSESAAANLKQITYHQEEPISSFSIAAQYEVMKLANENGIKVLLDGQGADELLAGYLAYWPTFFNQLYSSNRKKFKIESEAYAKNYDELPFENNLEFKWKAYHMTSFKMLSGLKRKFKPSSSAYFVGIHPDLVASYKDEPNPLPKTNSIKENLYHSLMVRGLKDLLRYADRNAMANSVEVRLPFLSHELVEYVFTLPDTMLLRNGWTKYILRKSMENILPSEITWRKDKVGYEPPQNEWMASPFFKNYLNDSLAYLKKEKIIAKEYPQLHWKYVSLFAFSQELS